MTLLAEMDKVKAESSKCCVFKCFYAALGSSLMTRAAGILPSYDHLTESPDESDPNHSQKE